MEPRSIGFVGMGVMGEPMAGHLVTAGLPVTVWNRTPGKTERVMGLGAKVAVSLGDLAKSCDVILSCVSRSEDVEQVILEMAPQSAEGTLFIDHSTIEPSVAVRLGETLRASGKRFVDAPITGGSMGAQKGSLTVFVGASEADAEQALAIIKHFSRVAARVGEVGQGQWMKLANQIAVGGALLGLCESIAFAEKSGLSVHQALELIGSGAGGSWAFANYGPRLLSRDWTPGFSITNQLKDFGYCKSAADSTGAKIPTTVLAQRLLQMLSSAGRGSDTTAALFEVFEGYDF